MKKLAQFSVDYPVTVAMIILGIVLLGFISFSRLGTDLFPNLNNPRIVVEVRSGERPPEEIEKQLVEPMEGAIIRQRGVVNVGSLSKVGSAQIIVEYNWDQDMDEAFLDLQKALTAYSQNEEVEELNIYRNDPNASPVMLAAISNPGISDMDELRKVAQNYIRNQLIRVDGIADVRLSGEQTKEIWIETDPYMLESHGITSSSIVSKIQSFNRNVSGGSIEELGQRYIIKGVSIYQSPQDLGKLVIGRTLQEDENGQQKEVPLLLRDVARVAYKNQEPLNIVRLNGQRCIGLSIYKETKYNTVAAVEALNEGFDKVKKALPGYEITIIKNQGKFIGDAIGEVKDSALIGIVFAVLVLFLFLRRIGTTLVVSAAIPISIIATFNLMYFNGLTLNIMTLGGLALGAGMLVDNAIIVVENIFSLLERGKPLRQAAVEGTAQVGGALVASTLTTIVVFLPIVYLHGASGELFKDQAWTVAFSLLSSLFVAILIIPILSVLLLGKRPDKLKVKQKSYPVYSRFLSAAIDKRYWVILAAIVLVACSYLSISFIGSEFMPKAKTREFSVEVTLPAGTGLQRTASTMQAMEEMISEGLAEHVAHVYTHSGPQTDLSGSGKSVFEGENTGFIKVIIREDSPYSSDDFIPVLSTLFTGIPDMELEYIQDETALGEILGSDAAPVMIEVLGEDLTVLDGLTDKVYAALQSNEALYNLKSSFQDGVPEVNVHIDRYRAGIFNINASSIITQLQEFLMGKDAGSIESGGELTDITLKMPDYPLGELDNFIIENGQEKYRLNELADISIGSAPKEVIRDNQNRVGRITAHIKGDVPVDQLAIQIEGALAGIEFPPGYRYQLKGEEMLRKESFGSLSFALLLSVILVYMVMASQFESLIHPFTILLTIPLAGVGALAAFLLLGMSLNIMAYIGLVMLAGIAVNDSIILVDAINQFKKEGMMLKEAVMAAANNRLRPIFMTSLTTILGLLPLTIGFGESAALRSSMAIAVIGGLLTSTLLTLVVIPCVYYVFDGIVRKNR
ncbi:hydrophobic/amphiphilic exporter-1, HAE1 family [Saccharicrinis carchari]|uniref:Hydrophobic/amphiphilic exporter-1, HAE1 family n=1 Tax=Saccharicrinis carchari TaxID=1168039 RepID=A0A521E1D2_SACCC|nr:efflux RND transporter permease subunit [Saccharicrinis carchari]SMO77779.1 hydrophobic/amphiphilic exporter-1, HAE1 family [Saccharicrinis carchari]